MCIHLHVDIQFIHIPVRIDSTFVYVYYLHDIYIYIYIITYICLIYICVYNVYLYYIVLYIYITYIFILHIYIYYIEFHLYIQIYCRAGMAPSLGLWRTSTARTIATWRDTIWLYGLHGPGKTERKRYLPVMCGSVPSGYVKIAMENHHFSWENSLFRLGHFQ